MKLTRKFSEAEQGTQEWLESRIGYVTASNMAAVMAGGRGVTRKNYMVKVLCEVLSGKPTNGYTNQYMQDGNDNEATARLAYELETGSIVTQRGFCYIPEIKLGASTDGEVKNENGIIEIKNVKPSVQVEFLISDKINPAYEWQMHTQMLVLDKDWCDFVSQSLGNEEDGELPENMQLKIKRVFRDPAKDKAILDATKKFHHELKQLIKKLEK